MRRSLPYLLLAAAAGLALPAMSRAEYVLRTRFLTVQFGRQAPPTPPPAPVAPQPLPPLPTDPGAPPPVPETLPPGPQPLPPEVEQPLTPPRPVQAPLPPAPVTPVAPVGPPMVAPALPPGPAPALPAAVTPALFVKAFQPLPGKYEVVLIHPYTGCPVTVRFCLPPCPLKKVHVNKHRIEFSYRGHRDVVIRFLKGGGVWVRE